MAPRSHLDPAPRSYPTRQDRPPRFRPLHRHTSTPGLHRTESPVKVAVVGAGAIGAYVGAALHRAGAEVHLIARGPHLAAMRRDGVRVISPRGDFTARPAATDDPREVGPVDFVLLGLKANSYAAAGPLVGPLLHDGTAVVAAQNGIPWWYFHGLPGPHTGRRIESVDPGGAVSATLPPARAIGCVVYAATEIESPGVVRHLEGTRFSIGEPDLTVSRRCLDFSEAMRAGGLKCPVEPDLRNDIWIKLLGNISFNPISALARATMAQICRHRGTRSLVESMMRETLAVAAAVGCHPEISVERRIAGAERVGDHKTSTLQDLEKGKPLELDVLLSAVVELAGLTTTPVPTLRAVHALADLLAQTSDNRSAA
ncbi:2-dehydropantoate 2-reductase [Streptomyces sp. SID1034]|uniref:2-dehydropantoate 2-reductase n=1 Tax=Streptomyces sp. SID1034 TaxID=2690248 RepID=UPI001368229D|nr:2-dehydropantoate 2-reductase [Streptomyces sp. SID1034]